MHGRLLVIIGALVGTLAMVAAPSTGGAATKPLRVEFVVDLDPSSAKKNVFIPGRVRGRDCKNGTHRTTFNRDAPEFHAYLIKIRCRGGSIELKGLWRASGTRLRGFWGVFYGRGKFAGYRSRGSIGDRRYSYGSVTGHTRGEKPFVFRGTLKRSQAKPGDDM